MASYYFYHLLTLIIMLLHARPEEHGVSIDYLQGLHEKHEQWLLPAQSRSSGVLSVSPALKEPMSPRIRDRVFYLEGDHVHSCIQKVRIIHLLSEYIQSVTFFKEKTP